jgi:hypothetical protein
MILQDSSGTPEKRAATAWLDGEGVVERCVGSRSPRA